MAVLDYYHEKWRGELEYELEGVLLRLSERVHQLVSKHRGDLEAIRLQMGWSKQRWNKFSNDDYINITVKEALKLALLLNDKITLELNPEKNNFKEG